MNKKKLYGLLFFSLIIKLLIFGMIIPGAEAVTIPSRYTLDFYNVSDLLNVRNIYAQNVIPPGGYPVECLTTNSFMTQYNFTTSKCRSINYGAFLETTPANDSSYNLGNSTMKWLKGFFVNMLISGRLDATNGNITNFNSTNGIITNFNSTTSGITTATLGTATITTETTTNARITTMLNLTGARIILPITPLTPIVGTMYYNATLQVPCFYNGSAWLQANKTTC